MPRTIPAQVVTTHAIIGDRGEVSSWFADAGLQTDMLRVAETHEMRDGVLHIDRYVAHDEITAAELERYDHHVFV